MLLGKTYTMLGTPDSPGIMALTLEDMFSTIEATHANASCASLYKVTVSFMEVYNENIRDLLVSGNSTEYLDLVLQNSSSFLNPFLILCFVARRSC